MAFGEVFSRISQMSQSYWNGMGIGSRIPLESDAMDELPGVKGCNIRVFIAIVVHLRK